MDQVKDILHATRTAHGWNKSQMARELGISSQLYGQYESGTKIPGGDFFIKWKKRFKTDLTGENETIVSCETQGRSMAYDALFSVLISEVAYLKAKETGEHPQVIERQMRKAAEDVLKLI